MKHFFLILIISFFLFPSCSETPIIVSEVCDITQEICYYANLVCENFNEIETPTKEIQALNAQLNQLNFEVKNISDHSLDKTLVNNFEYQQETKYRLIRIRDELKKIYENQKK